MSGRSVVYAYRYGIVGGVSSQLLLRQKAITKRGVACHLFFAQDNGLGGQVQDLDNVHFGDRVSIRKLLRSISPEQFVVVDTPELIGMSACPTFLDVHTTTRTGLGYLENLNYSALEGVLVPTSYSAGLVRSKAPGVAVHIVPNILDATKFRPCSSVEAGNVREYVWVGKLDHHKNWRLALLYLRLLSRMYPGARMTVVGGYTATRDRALEFFELVHRLGLTANVVWLDKASADELAVIYRSCAATGGAMIVTSRDESFGMAAGEALLCGCPLIANDLPVFREVLPQSKLVQLLDIWDPGAFAAAAERLDEGVDDAECGSVRSALERRWSGSSFFSAFQTAIGNEH